MPKSYRPYEPDQLLLMPPSLADWVPEDHLARFVGDVVTGLDLRAIEETYTDERGYPPYHPRMMVTLLLYAYCTGIYSARKIGRQVIDSVAFRFLAAGNTPDQPQHALAAEPQPPMSQARADLPIALAMKRRTLPSHSGS
jgi:transposase